ncbi:MAG: redoxin domain-containing protein [Thermomicrobiales bacterium]
MDTLLLILRVGLAVVFSVAGIAKLLDLPGSRKTVADFGVPRRFAAGAGLALPLTELVIAFLLLPASTAWWGSLGALVLLLTFIAAISITLSRGRAPDCHCFGQLHSEPAGPATLVRNGVLTACAGLLLIAGPSAAGASLADPVRRLSSIDGTLLIGELLLFGLVAILGWAVVQMMAQNGRILARLETDDDMIAAGGSVADVTASSRATHALPSLGVGAVAPDFTLPDLEGNSVTLAQLRAEHSRILLLFTDPGCGPCRAILPLVKQWQADAGRRLHIEVISRGDRAVNEERARAYSLSRVLLQADREVSRAYATGGTPAAVLIESDGTIGIPVAGGAEAIHALVTTLLGLESKPAQPTSMLPLTGRAPSFRLPTVSGAEVSLGALLGRGRPVMLHFMAPACGPCYELLPDIGGWQRHYHDRLTSVIVSSGTAHHNRLIMEEYGIDLGLVLLQEDREVFDAFGMRQMPSAMVIGDSGVIASEPSYGVHAVRALMADTLGLTLPELPQPVITRVNVGDPAPVFDRVDLQGELRHVGAPHGRDTVLLFWRPGCAHCEGLVPDLKAWEAHPDAPYILVISRGPKALNREFGIASPIVFDDDRFITRTYGVTGTPAAVVIDANGVIASPVGRGATGVRELLEPTMTLSTSAPDSPDQR